MLLLAKIRSVVKDMNYRLQTANNLTPLCNDNSRKARYAPTVHSGCVGSNKKYSIQVEDRKLESIDKMRCECCNCQ
jgi:hypothetical protein